MNQSTQHPEHAEREPFVPDVDAGDFPNADDVTTATARARAAMPMNLVAVRELAHRALELGTEDAVREFSRAVDPSFILELLATIEGVTIRFANAEQRARSLGARALAAENRYTALQDDCDRKVVAAREEAEIAFAAVSFALDRGQTDPDFAYYCGAGTEMFSWLCAAEAKRRGEPVDVVLARRSKDLQPADTKREADVVVLQRRVALADAIVANNQTTAELLGEVERLRGLASATAEPAADVVWRHMEAFVAYSTPWLALEQVHNELTGKKVEAIDAF